MKPNITIRNAVFFLAAFLLIVPAAGAADIDTDTAGDFEIIMERIRQEHMNIDMHKLDETIGKLLQLAQPEGSFADIDYSSRLQTVWPPLEHLNRIKDFAVGYTAGKSRFYGNDLLYKHVVNMLEYWHASHPTSTNWWFQQIASPQQTGIILIIMRSGLKKVPAGLEAKLLDRIIKEGGRPDQPGSLGTGANKLDIATHWIYRACLTQDAPLLQFSVEQAYQPLVKTTGEGLQHDYSYHQHGAQLYIGGYGWVLVEGITKTASYMTGTPYALADGKLELLSRFIRHAYIPVIRGSYFMFNTAGRSMSRKNALCQELFIPVLKRMELLDAENRTAYEDAALRISGKEPPGYKLLPYHTHFWRSDYTLHQRPGYTFDVRTASTFTCRNENGNGENLKGYFLTDGATDISISGDEYAGIIPVWDWAHIPGVTAPRLQEIPRTKAWGTRGKSTFTGGVSDGKYGVTCYRLNDRDFDINTKAAKSWFFFDDEVVCLGSGITSTAGYPVHTTINQCRLEGSVFAGSSTKMKEQPHSGVCHAENTSRVWHNNILYYFPEKTDVYISKQPQTGNWNDINNSIPAETVVKDVFQLWLDHGKNPEDVAYAYFVVPNIAGRKKAEKYNAGKISILSNTKQVQAVQHKGLGLLGVIFYEPASLKCNDISISADKPCVVMLKKPAGNNSYKVYLADPSRTQPDITLTIQLGEKTKTIECRLPVYPDPYAGSTFEYEF